MQYDLGLKFENRQYITNKTGCVLNLHCDILQGEVIVVPSDFILEAITRGQGKDVQFNPPYNSIRASIWWKATPELSNTQLSLLSFCCDKCGTKSVGFRSAHFRFSDAGKASVPVMFKCAPSHNRRPKNSVLVLKLEIHSNKPTGNIVITGQIELPFKKNLSKMKGENQMSMSMSSTQSGTSLSPPLDSYNYPSSSSTSSNSSDIGSSPSTDSIDSSEFPVIDFDQFDKNVLPLFFSSAETNTDELLGFNESPPTLPQQNTQDYYSQNTHNYYPQNTQTFQSNYQQGTQNPQNFQPNYPQATQDYYHQNTQTLQSNYSQNTQTFPPLEYQYLQPKMEPHTDSKSGFSLTTQGDPEVLGFLENRKRKLQEELDTIDRQISSIKKNNTSTQTYPNTVFEVTYPGSKPEPTSIQEFLQERKESNRAVPSDSADKATWPPAPAQPISSVAPSPSFADPPPLPSAGYAPPPLNLKKLETIPSYTLSQKTQITPSVTRHEIDLHQNSPKKTSFTDTITGTIAIVKDAEKHVKEFLHSLPHHDHHHHHHEKERSKGHHPRHTPLPQSNPSLQDQIMPRTSAPQQPPYYPQPLQPQNMYPQQPQPQNVYPQQPQPQNVYPPQEQYPQQYQQQYQQGQYPEQYPQQGQVPYQTQPYQPPQQYQPGQYSDQTTQPYQAPLPYQPPQTILQPGLYPMQPIHPPVIPQHPPMPHNLSVIVGHNISTAPNEVPSPQIVGGTHPLSPLSSERSNEDEARGSFDMGSMASQLDLVSLEEKRKFIANDLYLLEEEIHVLRIVSDNSVTV